MAVADPEIYQGGRVIRYVMLNITSTSHKSQCNKFLYK